MITHVTGDLLATDAESIAHGVNCLGIMGAGVAKALRAKYPDMFTAYRMRCRDGGLCPGQVFTWLDGSPMVIFNVATQVGITGPRATLPNVRQGLIATRQLVKAIGLRSVAMPRIGCGLGGLAWDDVRPIVEDVFKNWTGTVYVHTLPGDKP